jgi:ribulose-phosphate 3-epimerase
VDGGVNDANVRAANEAGANLLVAATAVFGDDGPAAGYRGLANALA